ncbi:membrane protein [Mycobacterium phage Hurricane]|uniref:Membrane protein n=1 Tax=Mycobacterium phage Hurricane TaxID=2015810 RepID=A0A222ZJE0_9CAUD|nr:membrane protein [Mycobacterium phage Hurricane]ASR84827.1 membrane protein [Mycobacterium phage Hurricane]
MSAPSRHGDRTPREQATRFFRGWLAAGVAASILGNVTHALLNTHAGNPVVAAALAAVAPIALLGATHGVHKLVQSRIIGGAYAASLWITVAVASSAFALSFASLRELAIGWGGIAPVIAWLVPVVIDLSITGSTIALLALSSSERAEVRVDEQAAPFTLDDLAQERASAWADRAHVHTEVHAAAHAAQEPAQPAARAAQPVQLAAIDVEPSTDPALFGVHAVAAERIVSEGVTRIDRGKVAEVLAEHAEGTAPSMIARKLGVGYSTVVRILEHHTAQDAIEASA